MGMAAGGAVAASIATGGVAAVVCGTIGGGVLGHAIGRRHEKNTKKRLQDLEFEGADHKKEKE